MTQDEIISDFISVMKNYGAQNMCLIDGEEMIPISDAIIDNQYQIGEAYEQPIKFSDGFLINTVDNYYGYGYGYAVGDGSDTYFDVWSIEGNLIGHFTSAYELLNLGTYGYGYGFEQYNVTRPNTDVDEKPYFYIPMDDIWNYTSSGSEYQNNTLKNRNFFNSYKVRLRLSNIFNFIDSTIQNLRSL